MFECVINVSEGRRRALLDELSASAGPSLRDRHSDVAHHRSVFTLINDAESLVRDVRSLITRAYELIDLRTHAGVHPRFGAVDVIPFVALETSERAAACELRDETAQWLAASFQVPVFLYGTLGDGSTRSLPLVRRNAFAGLEPDFGPGQPSPSRGAAAVGCRDVLVAWNLWLEGVTLDQARAMATSLRSAALRTLAFAFDDVVQVSCNVVDVDEVRLSQVYDAVRARLNPGARIARSELVGLAPRSLVERESPDRWSQLDLSLERTIEAALAGAPTLPANDAR